MQALSSKAALFLLTCILIALTTIVFLLVLQPETEEVPSDTASQQSVVANTTKPAPPIEFNTTPTPSMSPEEAKQAYDEFQKTPEDTTKKVTEAEIQASATAVPTTSDASVKVPPPIILPILNQGNN